jgi:hypothetical protein
MNVLPYAKAVVAAVSAGLLAVQTTITMSDKAHGWVTVTVAVLGTVAVYVVPNAPAGTPAPSTPDLPATAAVPVPVPVPQAE